MESSRFGEHGQLTGTVSRLGDIPGSKLFAAEYGYTEKRISSLIDLETFLAAADDAVRSTYGMETCG